MNFLVRFSWYYFLKRSANWLSLTLYTCTWNDNSTAKTFFKWSILWKFWWLLAVNQSTFDFTFTQKLNNTANNLIAFLQFISTISSHQMYCFCYNFYHSWTLLWNIFEFNTKKRSSRTNKWIDCVFQLKIIESQN